MLYLKQRFNIHPASPRTRDAFVAAADAVLPASAAAGGRLVGAWFANEEWFSQIIHLTEFDDFAALDEWRQQAASDDALGQSLARLAELAPERHEDLLEPLGPIGPEALQATTAACQNEPVETYTFAILELEPGAEAPFTRMIDGVKDQLPIIASLRDVAGSPNRIIDLWKGDTARGGYRPTNDAMDAFFEPLRKLAARERMMRLFPLPYSPLR